VSVQRRPRALRLAVLVGFASISLSPSSALAAAHTICVHFDLDRVLYDASPTVDGDVDFGETLGRRDDPAEEKWAVPRLLVRVSEAGQTAWGWRPLGGNGCTGPFESAGPFVMLEYLPWSYFSETGNQIVGYNCDSSFVNRCTFAPSAPSALTLDPSGTRHFTIDDPDDEGPDDALEASLWATAFAENRSTILSDSRTYLAYSDQGGSATGYSIGGQPTILIKGNGYKNKFTAAHEYGHVQTLFGQVPGIGPADVDYTYQGGNQHSMQSPEFQAAASFEGFAHYYALATWWDDQAMVAAYPLVSCVNCPPEAVNLMVWSDTDNPRWVDNFACGGPCPAGIGVEGDWMAALWNFNLGLPSSAPIPGLTLGMLGATHPWPANGLTQDYWEQLSVEVAAYINQAEADGTIAPGQAPALLIKFAGAAAAAGINR
jgi:hypothetical protein